MCTWIYLNPPSLRRTPAQQWFLNHFFPSNNNLVKQEIEVIGDMHQKRDIPPNCHRFASKLIPPKKYRSHFHDPWFMVNHGVLGGMKPSFAIRSHLRKSEVSSLSIMRIDGLVGYSPPWGAPGNQHILIYLNLWRLELGETWKNCYMILVYRVSNSTPNSHIVFR